MGWNLSNPCPASFEPKKLMGNPRPRPQLLAAKLIIIREYLRLDHIDMQRLLGLRSSTRIYEYEGGVREPFLEIVLAYSYAAKVPMISVCDDRCSIDEFRVLLGTFDIRNQLGLEPFFPNEESQQPQPRDRQSKSKPIILISGLTSLCPK